MNLLVWLLVYILSLFVVRVLGLSLFFSSRQRTAANRLSWIGQTATLHLGFVISETGVTLVLAGIIFRFYRYHIWLAKNNMTTFQHIMQSKNSKHYPHHKIVPNNMPEKIQQTVAGMKSSSEPSEGNEDGAENHISPHRPSSIGDTPKDKKDPTLCNQKLHTKQSADSIAFNKSHLVKQKLPKINKRHNSPEI